MQREASERFDYVGVGHGSHIAERPKSSLHGLTVQQVVGLKHDLDAVRVLVPPGPLAFAETTQNLTPPLPSAPLATTSSSSTSTASWVQATPNCLSGRP